ncbi:MAG: hypothetical protein P1U67_01590 [Alcanivoracaceae bacterium]|nr:hypothetical protein [Alcanivoracaceae bacterium]
MNRYWMTRHAVVVACALGFWGFTFSSSAAALEAISDDSDVPLDFSSDESRQETDNLEGSTESQSPTSRPRGETLRKRLGPTTRLKASISQASSDHGDGYKADFDISSGIGFTLRLNDYFSWGVGAGRGSYKINFDTLRLPGPFLSNEYALVESKRLVDQKSLGTSLTWSVLGGAYSTPYISVGRTRIDYESELSGNYTIYSYFSPTPIETSSLPTFNDEDRRYSTGWSIGYEHALNEYFSVSGGFGHSLSGGKTIGRTFGADVDVWLTPHVALSVGASKSHETGRHSFSTYLAWLL